MCGGTVVYGISTVDMLPKEATTFTGAYNTAATTSYILLCIAKYKMMIFY
jgi:hypothetical protein